MPSRLELHDLLDKLGSASDRIRFTMEEAQPKQLYAPLAAGEWSAAQIFAHVRASDDVLAYRCYLILAHDHPHYHDLDERRWEEVLRYVDLDIAQSLRTFALRRRELMHMLRRASLEDWSRAGTHEQRGEQSLWTVASHLSEHEEEHIAQLCALAVRMNLLRDMAKGLRLKDHCDIEGNKTYRLHRPDDNDDVVDAADVEALVELGLISRNKKFPTATYWLTERGGKLIADLGDA